jgi:ubiquinone/menaquinone biosynthesis C-methylase UbiE
MIEAIAPFLQCPRCKGRKLECSTTGVFCSDCKSLYPNRDGIIDWLGVDSKEVITPFQRVMQTPPVVAIYEGIWRRLGYYIASSRSFESELATVLQLQPKAPISRTLDLACGTGVFTRPLARRSQGVVIGFDLSWPMLRRARLLAAREGRNNIVWMRGTAFQLPFSSGSFQHVNCCGALHLFDQPDRALVEIHRLLAAGGSFSVQTTIRPERSAGMAYLLERFIRFGFFNENELKESVASSGFQISESERHRISYTFLARK